VGVTYREGAPLSGTNIEFKARLHDWENALRIARAWAAEEVAFGQRDTFYHVPAGHLKLREHFPGPAELIGYVRAPGAEPRESRYRRMPVAVAAGMHVLLGAALGVRGVVEKKRIALLRENVRIHFDDVAGLGRFLEIEVILTADHPEAVCEETARAWIRRLGVAQADLVERAYIDLLE